MTSATHQRTPEVMRQINKLVSESLGDHGRTEPTAFFCECLDPRCYRTVWLTPSEYAQACRDPSWAALAAGHAALP